MYRKWVSATHVWKIGRTFEDANSLIAGLVHVVVLESAFRRCLTVHQASKDKTEPCRKSKRHCKPDLCS